MIEIRGMPGEDQNNWYETERNINNLLPHDLRTNHTMNEVPSTAIHNALGTKAMVRIYLALMNLMDVINGTKVRYISSFARDAHTTIQHVNLSSTTMTTEWFIIGRMSEEEQDIVRARYGTNRRLTALEAHLQKNKERVTVIRTDYAFIYLTNKKIRTNTFYSLLSTYYTLVKNETRYSLDIIEDFLEGLRSNDLKQIETALNKVATLPIIKELKTERYKSIFVSPQKASLDQYVRNLQNIQSTLERLERQYAEQLEKYDKENAIFESLQKMDKEIDVKEIIDHIETCPYIDFYEPIGDGQLRLRYYAPLLSYDEFLAEKKMFGASDFEKKILDIFAHYGDKYEIWTECELIMTPAKNNVIANRVCQYISKLGHPHLDRHGCKGTHINYIIESMRKGDYKTTINQITEMAIEFNFRDGVVIRNFMEAIRDNKEIKAWKKKSTGEFISTVEVLEEIENGKTETNIPGAV